MYLLNSFDCDGVITLGIYPGSDDIIITGRSFEEEKETLAFFENRHIYNEVFFSPHTFAEKTREKSGIHKGNTIKRLYDTGVIVKFHFEDDPVQIAAVNEIIKLYNLQTIVIRIDHGGAEELENVRRDSAGNVIGPK